jgi:hypothetical protein
MWDRLKFVYKALNRTVQNWIILKWTMWSHIMWDLHSSKILHSISGNSATMFWDNLTVPTLRVKKSKRENKAWQKLTDTIFLFLNFVHRLISCRDAQCFRSWLCFSFQAKKEAPNSGASLGRVILNDWAPETVTCYVFENGSSHRKMVTEKLIKTTRLKNITWTNTQINRKKKKHELIQTTDSKQNSRTRVLTFLTPLTPFVEKTVNLHGLN